MLTTYPVSRSPHSFPLVLLSSGLLLLVWLAVSLAQVRTHITPDNSLGTTVTPHGNGRVHTIGGGTMRGSNLFHASIALISAHAIRPASLGQIPLPIS
jgi:hypothetical protein